MGNPLPPHLSTGPIYVVSWNGIFVGYVNTMAELDVLMAVYGSISWRKIWPMSASFVDDEPPSETDTLPDDYEERFVSDE